MTLTFARNSGPLRAKATFRTWIRRLERKTGRPLLWFLGLEDGHQLGRLHIHALVGGTDALGETTLEEAWEEGFSRIERFQPGLGAAHYVTKYITKELLDYDISPNVAQAVRQREKQLPLGSLRTPPIARRKKHARRS
ncbi:MAG: hypothetical protein ACKVZ0_23290 [Gemmatimonadales bacterium]